jgi:hypothetical protein
MSKKLQEIIHKTEQVGGYSLLISIEDVDWLIEQTKKLEWLKMAVEVCNDEKLTPSELADILRYEE